MADQQQATEAVSASTEVKSTEQATAVPQPTTVEPKTPAKVDQQPEDSGDEDDDEDESSPSTPSQSGSAKKRVVKNRGRIKRVKKTPQKESATDSSPAKSTKTGHHLENTWTFWFSKKPSKMNPAFNWVESLRKLGTFNTVEDFWRYFKRRSGSRSKIIIFSIYFYYSCKLMNKQCTIYFLLLFPITIN